MNPISSPLPSRSRHLAPRAPATAPSAAAGLSTRVLNPRALEAVDLAAWQALENRALEPNGYLSPHFVLPALQHLDPQLEPALFVAEHTVEGERRLLGLALLHRGAPGRALPLPHLRAYQSRHSYLGHWLLDRQHAADAATALLQAMRRHHPWAAAVVLPDAPLDGAQAAALHTAAARIGSRCTVTNPQTRAVLMPAHAGAAALRERLGPKQHANNERCRRRLQEQGPLAWEALRGSVSDAAIETFLALEHGGWKRDHGTSLRSQPADEAFFVAMARRFAAVGQALFTELKLDGRVIASTANFISGDLGFAFKVGWDEAYRKFGAGILNEGEFVRHAQEVCADLRCIDSGAQPASFIEMLWPEQRAIGTVQIPLRAPGRWALAAAGTLRAWRQARRLKAPA